TERDRVHQGIPHEETKSAAVAAAKAGEGSPTTRNGTPLLPAGEVQPQTHIGALILGICAALATFVLGMLISTDQKQLK
ncbi:MAG: hypothetical protein ABI700_22375, partial [Chloroflexota bacterium]